MHVNANKKLKKFIFFQDGLEPVSVDLEPVSVDTVAVIPGGVLCCEQADASESVIQRFNAILILIIFEITFSKIF